MSVFSNTTNALFESHYPSRAVQVQHQLSDHPLFQMEALLQLAAALPEQYVEYNLGELPVNQDPTETPGNGLSITDTIRQIGTCNSWMVLKRVEQDQTYAALMESCLEGVGMAVAPLTGQMLRKEAFIFISSPGSVTPFHMDPEHNILMQIRGQKTVHMFPANDSLLVSAEQHEHFHYEGHRNLPYRDEFAGLAESYTLNPNDALYFPVKAPHWVQNGDAVSVSFSITWRSRYSEQMAYVHHANRVLRGMGFKPRSAGQNPVGDRVKETAYRCWQKLHSLSG